MINLFSSRELVAFRCWQKESWKREQKRLAFGPDSPISINDPALPYIHLSSQTKKELFDKYF